MFDGLQNLQVPSPRKRLARRLARFSVVGLVVLLLGVGGTGLFVYKAVNDRLRRAHDPSIVTDDQLPDGPTNVLVVGSDRRDVFDKRQRRENPELRGPSGQRADTIMLLHISGKARKAVALHLPRDLRVQIPGRSGFSKINATFSGSGGGPNLLIETIKAMTGIPIHHYVEINFASFQTIVDSVGGVHICVTRAYDDKKSGLKIPQPGCYDMEGKTALSFVRARNIDPRADLGRIERQQLFMRALMSKVKSVRFLFDVPRVLRVAEAVGAGVVLDQKVDLTLARGIAQKLAGDQKNVDFRIVPVIPRFVGGVSYVVAVDPDAARLFRAIREDRGKLPDVGKTGLSIPKRKDVSVRLLNGTGQDGFAGTEAARLRELGFRVPSVGTAKMRDITHIRFSPGAELKARLLEEEYPGAVVEVAAKDQPTDLVVRLGKDVLQPQPDEA